MKLKNRTSQGKNTFDNIQRLLAEAGAQKIMFDYELGGTGKLEAISFTIDVNGRPMGFRLPALVEHVTQILYGGEDRWGNQKKITLLQREQAYKTAWANIRDWIDAQLALVKTKQVDIGQVFIPYMIMKGGETLYQNIINDPKFLLE